MMKILPVYRLQSGNRIRFATCAPVFLAIMAMLGCSSQHRLATVPKDMMGETLRVELRDGRVLKAYAVPSATGVVWRPRAGGEDIPHEAVVAVSRFNHARGAVHGLGLGLLIGASLGAFVGYMGGESMPEESCDPCLGFSRSEAAILSGIGFGLLGSLGGFLFGGLVGSAERYQFGRDGAVPATPAPGGATATLSWSF